MATLYALVGKEHDDLVCIINTNPRGVIRGTELPQRIKQSLIDQCKNNSYTACDEFVSYVATNWGNSNVRKTFMESMHKNHFGYLFELAVPNPKYEVEWYYDKHHNTIPRDGHSSSMPTLATIQEEKDVLYAKQLQEEEHRAIRYKEERAAIQRILDTPVVEKPTLFNSLTVSNKYAFNIAVMPHIKSMVNELCIPQNIKINTIHSSNIKGNTSTVLSYIDLQWDREEVRNSLIEALQVRGLAHYIKGVTQRPLALPALKVEHLHIPHDEHKVVGRPQEELDMP